MLLSAGGDASMINWRFEFSSQTSWNPATIFPAQTFLETLIIPQTTSLRNSYIQMTTTTSSRSSTATTASVSSTHSIPVAHISSSNTKHIAVFASVLGCAILFCLLGLFYCYCGCRQRTSSEATNPMQFRSEWEQSPPSPASDSTEDLSNIHPAFR